MLIFCLIVAQKKIFQEKMQICNKYIKTHFSKKSLFLWDIAINAKLSNYIIKIFSQRKNQNEDWTFWFFRLVEISFLKNLKISNPRYSSICNKKILLLRRMNCNFYFCVEFFSREYMEFRKRIFDSTLCFVHISKFNSATSKICRKCCFWSKCKVKCVSICCFFVK